MFSRTSMARPPAPIKTVPFSKEKPLPQPVPPSPTSAEVNIGDDEQPVASSSTPPRPGTSGTLTALQLDRLRASENLKAAARKEKAYRAKKRAATARANYSECKHHLKLAKAHFSSGFKLLGGVIKSTPYLFTEKLEGRKQKKEEKKREKVLEKRRKLDEELARVEREERAERERERREQRERDRDSDSESDRDGDVSDEERQEEEERPRDDEKKKNEAKSKGKGKARR